MNQNKLKNQNGLFTSKMIECISQKAKPKDYLMDKLKISNVSAYRRMRGEIPFSLDEAVEIATELGISLDDIAESRNSHYPDYQENKQIDMDKAFLCILQEYAQYLDIINNAGYKKVQASMSNLNFFLLLEYDSLFKLFYYKWLQLSGTNNQTFSQIRLPAEIVRERESILSKIQNFNSFDFIVDKNLFFPIIREIQYFHHRKLISKEGIQTLKDELISLLNKLESWMQETLEDVPKNFYLSLLFIEDNSICISYDHSIVSLHWLYSGKTKIIKETESCTIHKKWLFALKKSSVLISESNEMSRIEFIDQQRKYIESISDQLNK